MESIGNMRSKSLLPIDEINNLKPRLIELKENGNFNTEEIEDSVLDLLIMSYVFGCDAVNEDLETEIAPKTEQMQESIYKPIADKTFVERIREYVRDEDIESIMRVADTESHRVYNEGQFNTANNSGLNVNKTWVTMLDERVRDTHVFLEGVSVALNEKFYTYDGDSAYYPSGFESASENCNCRCELQFSKVGEMP